MAVDMEKGAENMKLKVLHVAMQTIIQPICSCVRPPCFERVCGKTWLCHPSSILCCGDNPEGNDMCREKNAGTAYQFIRFMITKHEISDLKARANGKAQEMGGYFESHVHH